MDNPRPLSFIQIIKKRKKGSYPLEESNNTLIKQDSLLED